VTIVDARIEWELTYEYWVTPITHWQVGGKNGDVEGEDSPREKILAHDIFPLLFRAGCRLFIQAIRRTQPWT